MFDWLQRQLGVKLDEANLLVAVAGVVVAALVALAPGVRRLISARRARSRRFERRYIRWFTQSYGRVYNIYLNLHDELDLQQSYVSLSFRSRNDQEQRLPANLVLQNGTLRRVVMIGEPGSGKSTLLKAYGVGIIRPHRKTPANRALAEIQRSGEVPFYVPLRALARGFGDRHSLLRYLIDEVLVHDVGLKNDRATNLLARLLRERRLLLFLDGLDEVPKGKLEATRAAIMTFCSDKSDDMPTHFARVVVACRRQNFLDMADQWLPSFAPLAHTLSPLRDNEILEYAHNLQARFTPPRSPETYIFDLQGSGLLDYHRTPLVLAISTGLYLSNEDYEIPRSVPLLYHAMVDQLLSRHDFRLEPSGKSNRFRTKDKYTLLQRFALQTARASGFSEFTKREVIDFGCHIFADHTEIQPSQVQAMVDEIIIRSGLLTSVNDEGTLIMAHRSIHEYLVASELACASHEGTNELMDRVTDPEWRQVVLIYSSLFSAGSNLFLNRVAAAKLELAGHCLAVADVDVSLGCGIIRRLAKALDEGDSVAYLAAMLAASRNENPVISRAATDAVKAALVGLTDATGLLRRADVDEQVIVNIIDTVIRTENDDIIALIPQLAAMMPNEPQVIAPLWRCLSIPDADSRSVTGKIVSRLLDLAVDPECFEELQRQEPLGDPVWLSPQARRRAYPFRKGLPIESNLVTLLAWADHLEARPTDGNRFTEARWTDAKRFATLESDLNRTLRVKRYVLLTALKAMVCAIPGIAATLRIVGDSDVLLQPFGWRTLLIMSAPMGVGGLTAVLLGSSLSGLMEFLSWLVGLVGLRRLAKRLAFAYEPEARVLPSDWLGERLRVPVQFLFYFALTLSVGVALAPLLHENGLWKFSVVSATTMAAITAITLIPGYDTWVYLRQPNPFIDLYEDPGSIHWVRTGPLSIIDQRRQARRQARQRAQKQTSQAIEAPALRVGDVGPIDSSWPPWPSN